MTRSILPFLLLAFVLGGALGFVLGRQAEVAVPDGGAPATAPAKSTRSPNPDPEAVQRAADSRDERVDLDGIVRSADPVPEERGTGRITGKVVDETGRPLAGVTVRAVTRAYYSRRYRPTPEDGSPPLRTSLKEEMRWLLDREVARRAGLRRTVTGADGAFTFTELADREYYLTAYRKGLKFEAKNGSGWVHPDANVLFVGSPLAMVELEILGPDGEPVPEASLQCIKARNRRHMTWVREKPVIYLDFSEWRIKAEAGPHKVLASEEAVVNLTPETSPARCVLRLLPRSGIAGRVVFPADEGASKVEVWAAPEAVAEDGLNVDNKKAVAQAKAADGGRFWMLDLAPGPWKVGLEWDTLGTGTKTVTVGEGLTEVEIVAPAPTPEQCVDVSVIGPGGDPVPDVRLSGYVSGPGFNLGGGGRTVPLADVGRYRYYFRGSSDWTGEDHAAGRIRRFVDAASALYGARRVAVPAGTRQVEIRFEEPAKLVVTLEGWGKSGLEGILQFGLTSGTPRGTNLVGITPDKEGKAEFGPLAPREYTVYLSGLINRDDRVAFEKRKLTLPSGESRLVFQMPVLYDVTAVVAGGGNSDFRLVAGDGSWETFPRTTKEGEITWRVPAGEYKISPWGGDLEPAKRIRVPGQNRVVFREMKPDCFEVKIEGPGRLASAGLLNGDLIVGIDGEAFTDSTQMWALRTLARDREKVTLTVLRGSGEVKIEIPGQLLRSNRKEDGGRIEQAMR